MAEENAKSTAPVHAVVRQRWQVLLAKIEQSGTEGIWLEVDESSQEWQDLKSMAERGIVFHFGLRAGGKEAGWHAYEKAREYFGRIV
jgi:hypothetical protein